MAIVKGPALSLAASGNLGAICYSRWRGLAIARDVWTGTFTPTPKQDAVMARVTVVSQAWGGLLSEAERSSWREAAAGQVWRDKLAGSYTPAGYFYFCKLNLNRAFMGLGIMVMPPASIDEVLAESMTLEWRDGVQKVRMKLIITVGTGDVDWIQYFKAGPYNSPGRHAIEGEWRYLDRKAAGTYLYDADVVPGKWYWYRGRWFLDEGVVGNFFIGQVFTGV